MSAAHPFRRRVLLNTLATFAGNGWAMAVSLIALPLLLHGLGAAGFGLWALLQTFSAVTGWLSVVHSGVGTAATRLIAEGAACGDRRRVGDVIGTTLVLAVGAGGLFGGLLALAGPVVLPTVFDAGPATDALRVAILFFAGQTAAEVLIENVEACLEGLQRVDVSRATDAVRRTLVAGATVDAALSGHGLDGVAAAGFGATLAGALASLGILRWVSRGHHVAWEGAEAAALLRSAGPIMLLRPLGVLERTMDRLIVGVALGPASVAVVEIATQVANGASAVLSASAYAVVPAASWLRGRGDRAALRDLVERGTRYSLLMTLPVVVGVAILIAPALRLWVGAAHSDAIVPAVLALATVAQVSPLQVGSELLLGTGHTTDILRAAACAIVINLAVSVALVHLFGIAGTFIGTLVAGCVLLVLLGHSILREVGESAVGFGCSVVLPVLTPVAMLAATATIALMFARIPDAAVVLLAATLGAAAYAAGVSRFAMRRGELASLRRLVLQR